MNNLIRASLASFEKAAIRENKFSIVTVSILNRNAVPDYVTAWIYSLSDQIIEVISSTDNMGLEETILVPNSPVQEFKPRHYTVRLSKEHRIQIF